MLVLVLVLLLVLVLVTSEASLPGKAFLALHQCQDMLASLQSSFYQCNCADK